MSSEEPAVSVLSTGDAASDRRQEALKRWVSQCLGGRGIALAEDWSMAGLGGDASFRRYFRVRSHNLSWVAVDAPPASENSAAFVAVARAWEALAIPVPAVYEADLQRGFMLLSDLGDQVYLAALEAQTADPLYDDALRVLSHIQQCRSIPGHDLPEYDRAFLDREMALFSEWFLGGLLQLSLSDKEAHLLEASYTRLADSALEQPRVCVHRDYHSRNLMVIEGQGPGVLDFQDAVRGPVTYDLVSLLRDCYIDWPQERVRTWALSYLALGREAGILPAVEESRFLRWFDLMGMQRHLKAVGIFARLWLRDGRAGYLQDIPRTLGYLLQVGRAYPEFAGLVGFLESRVLPAMSDNGAFQLPPSTE